MNILPLATIAVTVRDNLNGAEIYALVPDSHNNIVREDYWERAWIVTWQRELRNGHPDKSGDGMSYGTHRVHVNSLGESACFIGHFDQTREAALLDMIDRAGIKQKGNKMDEKLINAIGEVIDDAKVNGDKDTDEYIDAIVALVDHA